MTPDDEGGSDAGQADLANDLAEAWDQAEAVEPVSEDLDAADRPDRPDAILAPQHWSEADQDAFNSLPDQAKPLYMEKVRSLESGFNRKFEELAGARKQLESVQDNIETLQSVWQVLAPHQEQLAAANLTPGEYVGRLVSVAQHLQANPEATIRWLAETHGAISAMPKQEPNSLPSIKPPCPNIRTRFNGCTLSSTTAMRANGPPS
jgi:hypothetical protein